MQIETHVSLKDYSTFKIGGPAKFFTTVSTLDELKAALNFAKEKNIPFHCVGKGSNTLFDDQGYNGLIIHNKLDHLSIHGNKITVGAGFSFSLLGSKASRIHLTGLEFASGIPGSVGGAIYMNAGANGAETADCLECVSFVDENGDLTIYSKEQLEFSYRYSSFQKLKGVIIEATFTLSPSESAYLKQREIVEKRIKTQPYSIPSCGCIFRNPENGSAGKLIDECGLKGDSLGGAEVSTLHANFIVNPQNAKASDVLALIEKIKREVRKQKGVELHPEIRWIPFN